MTSTQSDRVPAVPSEDPFVYLFFVRFCVISWIVHFVFQKPTSPKSHERRTKTKLHEKSRQKNRLLFTLSAFSPASAYSHCSLLPASFSPAPDNIAFMKTDPAIRITLLPRDTNSGGTIFGGIILSYIDMAGAIEAVRHTGIERFVTVAMREVIFHKPVFVGDLMSLYAEVLSTGNTSITVRVIVEVERVGARNESVRVTEAEVIYVAVDEQRQKVKIEKRSEG